MKKAIDVVNQAFENEITDKQAFLDPIIVQLVERIFVKMALICRGFDAFYRDRSRLDAEKSQWILAFMRHGINNQEQIQPALNRLEIHKFPNPPQLGEFLDWRFSDPQDMGFPSVDEAYRISLLINRQFSDYKCDDSRLETVIRHAISQIDSSTYRLMNTEKSRRTFEHYYAISLRQFMTGEIKPITKAISSHPEPHSESREMNDAAYHKAMRAIRKMGINIKYAP